MCDTPVYLFSILYFLMQVETHSEPQYNAEKWTVPPEIAQGSAVPLTLMGWHPSL